MLKLKHFGAHFKKKYKYKVRYNSSVSTLNLEKRSPDTHTQTHTHEFIKEPRSSVTWDLTLSTNTEQPVNPNTCALTANTLQATGKVISTSNVLYP